MKRYSNLPVYTTISIVTARNEADIADSVTKSSVDYWTNDSGEGLFILRNGAMQQIFGNSQFHAKNRAELLRKTRDQRCRLTVQYTPAAAAEDEAERDAYYAKFED